MGKVNAATVLSCQKSFKNIKLALLVGICGSIPFNEPNEILLGDVVISTGVVQYDLGRQYDNQFQTKADLRLNQPRQAIRSLLAKLEVQRNREDLEAETSQILTALGQEVFYPGAAEDKLFKPSYRHRHQHPSDCYHCVETSDSVCSASMELPCEVLGCDKRCLVPRIRQNKQNQPIIHLGMIASGDKVIKSTLHRDKLAKETGAIAFEMEGAGLWEAFDDVLIIKGVCDYSDSHKNKKWQKYAAATAAACVKAFLMEYWLHRDLN